MPYSAQMPTSVLGMGLLPPSLETTLSHWDLPVCRATKASDCWGGTEKAGPLLSPWHGAQGPPQGATEISRALTLCGGVCCTHVVVASPSAQSHLISFQVLSPESSHQETIIFHLKISPGSCPFIPVMSLREDCIVVPLELLLLSFLHPVLFPFSFPMSSQ